MSVSAPDSLTSTPPRPISQSQVLHQLYHALLSQPKLLPHQSWLLREMSIPGSARQSCSAKQHTTALGEAVNAWKSSESYLLSTFLEERKGGPSLISEHTSEGIALWSFSSLANNNLAGRETVAPF